MDEGSENFNLDSYYESILTTTERNIDEIIERMKPELLQLLQSKNAQNVSEESINESCNRLVQKIKQYFEKNFAKFQLYTLRNIFNPPTNINPLSMTPLQESSSSSNNNNNAIPDQIEDAEEIELTKTLEKLREKYLTAQGEYLHLSSECRDMDTLLKEMRNAMFNLRVALQSLEDFEILPLSDTTYMITQYQQKLQQCQQDAEDLLSRIRQYESSQSEQKEQEKDLINVDNTESIVNITRALQGK